MRMRIIAWAWKLAIVALSGQLFMSGCVRNLQQEIEVLLAPAANPTLLYDSWVFNQFGPRFMVFFSRLF